MEAEYLRAKVGDALAEGMAETAMTRPADPVEFLGLWLQKYCENIEDARIQKEIQQRYQAEEEQAAADAEIAKNAADAEKGLEARDAAELETMNGIISDESSADVLQDSVLEYLKTKTGASAAYLGVCGTKTETVGEGDEATEVTSDVIEYVAATSNQKFLIGKSLTKPAEDAKDQTGVLSFGIFEREEATPPEPAEGEEPPAAPEGGWGTRWVTPYLRVPECVRNDKIKYFRTPKLGSYLTVPYEYSFEEDTMNEGDGPDIVDGACPPFPEFTTETKQRRGAVSLDTLGTDGEFTDADCATAVEWVAKLSEGLARTANDKVAAERALRAEVTVANEEQWTALEAARKELEASLPALLEESKAAAAALRAEGVVAEGDEPPAVPEETEAEVTLREGSIKLTKLTERISKFADPWLSQLAERTDASRHWAVLKAFLSFVGAGDAEEEAYDSWEKCKAALGGVITEGEEFVLGKVDVTAARDRKTFQSAPAVAAMLEGIDGKNVERTHVPISMLLEWLQQALAVHGAAVEVRKAKKAEVEAAGSEYTEQVEDNITDKAEEEEAPAAEE